MNKLTEEQNTVIEQFTQKYVQVIINREHQSEYKKDKIHYIRQKLSLGELVEALGESKVKFFYSNSDVNIWKNVHLRATDLVGNNVGGMQSELDFFVHYLDNSSRTEIISVKLNGKKINPSRDLSNLKNFYNVKINGIQAELVQDLTNRFSEPDRTNIYNNATHVVVKYQDLKTGQINEIPLSEFRQKIPEPLIPDSNKYSTKVRGLAPDDTATKKTIDYIKLGINQQDLLDRVINIIDKKLEITKGSSKPYKFDVDDEQFRSNFHQIPKYSSYSSALKKNQKILAETVKEDKLEKTPNSQTNNKLKELKTWREQAQQLGRSQNYLKKIDRVIDYASKNPDKFALSDTKSLEAAMKYDQTEFQKLQQDSLEQSSSIKRKRKR